jgi:hypothetical protein
LCSEWNVRGYGCWPCVVHQAELVSFCRCSLHSITRIKEVRSHFAYRAGPQPSICRYPHMTRASILLRTTARGTSTERARLTYEFSDIMLSCAVVSTCTCDNISMQGLLDSVHVAFSEKTTNQKRIPGAQGEWNTRKRI